MMLERIPNERRFRYGKNENNERNPSLPDPKEYATGKDDPLKEIILSYLRENLVCYCLGIVYDEVNPEKEIGSGHIFTDGTFLWDDVFTNYVDRYNIPVPEPFRKHILENFAPRMKRKTTFEQIDRITILNNPYLGYRYEVSIEKTGAVRYQSTLIPSNSFFVISPKKARYIINPLTKQLFCYDTDQCGHAIIDGYYWRITYFRKDAVVDTIKGWPGEAPWRNEEIKEIIAFIERYIHKDLGSDYMVEGK